VRQVRISVLKFFQYFNLFISLQITRRMQQIGFTAQPFEWSSNVPYDFWLLQKIKFYLMVKFQILVKLNFN